MAVSSSQQRGQWGSKLGFILAAAGSAIGLGNIWRFPYVAGENGGGAFVVVYLACTVLICLPYMLAELALGRRTQRNPIGAIRALRPGSPWVGVGWLGVLTGFAILSYYSVIAGWTVGYIVKMLAGNTTPLGEYVATWQLQLPLTAGFLLLTASVVYGGVEGGIERWSKVLMPVLFVLMLVLIVRGLLLEGASEGLEFYLHPDFSKITGKVVLAALGQAFFSMSLGMGLMVTYGSYLSRKDNMATSGAWVAVFDTAVALMAGLMIFPALFAMGKSPEAGPALVFETLPGIFATMPAGTLIGAGFFLLLSIAALTSTISLHEVATAFLVDERGWKRSRAVWAIAGVVFALAVPSALSQGAVGFLSDLPVVGMDFLSFMDFVFGNLTLALGGLLTCVFVAWIWGVGGAVAELREGSGVMSARVAGISVASVWGVFIRFICPVVIFIVLLNIFFAGASGG